MLDSLFALIPVPNDLAPKQNEQIMGRYFYLGGASLSMLSLALLSSSDGDGAFSNTMLSFTVFTTSSLQNNISLLSQVGITLDGSEEALVIQKFFQLVEGQCCPVG
jgi:hypothetical protein